MTQVAFAILLAHLQCAAEIQQCDCHTQLLSYKGRRSSALPVLQVYRLLLGCIRHLMGNCTEHLLSNRCHQRETRSDATHSTRKVHGPHARLSMPTAGTPSPHSPQHHSLSSSSSSGLFCLSLPALHSNGDHVAPLSSFLSYSEDSLNSSSPDHRSQMRCGVSVCPDHHQVRPPPLHLSRNSRPQPVTLPSPALAVCWAWEPRPAHFPWFTPIIHSLLAPLP